ncbi:MAG TPA: dienelactone hydrolase family protein [Nitrospiraceae bacterium]|nr:dienelactone hydrolase family protein [Nitrospiraceae bacterium]
MRALLMMALVLAASLTPLQLAGAESLTTEDNKTIDITYYPAAADRAPVVVLIPDTRCDRSVFRKLPLQLQKAGFAVVATDLRYKILIAGARSREEAIRTLQKQDTYAPVIYDMKSVLHYLAQKKDVDSTRIALLGTSYGSRVAIHAGVQYNVAALVLVSLSGEEALPGSPVRQLLEEYDRKPVLLMTAEKDWGNNFKATQDNKTYVGWGKGKRDLKIWPGSAHGPDIVEDKDPSAFVTEWLKANL